MRAVKSKASNNVPVVYVEQASQVLENTAILPRKK
jgi:hypothetical protein